MIEPTVGRVVWYHPDSTELPASPAPGTPLAAHVAAVNGDGSINLMVIDADGVPVGRRNVHLVQDGETPPAGAYAEWMPYQKGQAAKAEALQAQVAAAQPAPAEPPAPAPEAPAPAPASA